MATRFLRWVQCTGSSSLVVCFFVEPVCARLLGASQCELQPCSDSEGGLNYSRVAFLIVAVLLSCRVTSHPSTGLTGPPAELSSRTVFSRSDREIGAPAAAKLATHDTRLSGG
ncbi:hypothetical protein PR003_g11498 [Phytophthora rubi]|uniref:Secreted protein n=1 Tax=Phytophthora rubi TaxID=129364 RepID=A0A6A3MWH0_9STRA|nr:hypothetical protein PR002_g6537 [Phytophthora rubi]KAE9046634.1 hypothetical protein PR001_g4470 [Phytophthora rubi]KAE9338444.1 hypothetical protein PR003_g11498 [Phytophthora rubi]